MLNSPPPPPPLNNNSSHNNKTKPPASFQPTAEFKPTGGFQPALAIVSRGAGSPPARRRGEGSLPGDGAGGPPFHSEKGTPAGKGTPPRPHTRPAPFPPGDTSAGGGAGHAPPSRQGWESAGRLASPYLTSAGGARRAPAAGIEEAGCRRRASGGERGREGAELSSGQEEEAAAGTCGQPSLRRCLKTDIKAAGGGSRTS